MDILQLAEEHYYYTFAIVFGIGLLQGAILARGIRRKFPKLKKYAKGVSIILLILFSINAAGNISKFAEPSKESTKSVGAACARISRYEGMEAHARTGDVRLRKYGFSN